MSKHPENPFKNYEDYLAKSPFQTIKLLLPFLPAANQKTMVILIKFLELKYTMEYFKKGNPFSFSANLQEDASPLERVSSIIDFLPPKEQESVEQLINMMSVMEAFQTMTEAENEEPEENKDFEENEDFEESFQSVEPSHEEENYNDSEDLFQSTEPSYEEEHYDSEDPFHSAEPSSDNDDSSDISTCSNIEF